MLPKTEFYSIITNIINNHILFELLEAYDNLNSDIINKRNDSSHDGKQKIPFSYDRKLFLWASKVNEYLSKFTPSSPIHERNSSEYSKQIHMAKKESLNEMRWIRFNTFAVTRCILCSLFEKTKENVKQHLPNLDKRVMDILSEKS